MRGGADHPPELEGRDLPIRNEEPARLADEFADRARSDGRHLDPEALGQSEREPLDLLGGPGELRPEVVALGGETREYDVARGSIGAPIVAFTGEASGPDPVPCSFALLGAPEASCQRGGRPSDVPARPATAYGANVALKNTKNENETARPPVAFSGAAPAAFTQSTTSTAGAIATIFLAIVTVGLVILPDGSSSTSYTLVSTHRGEEGAAEAPSS